MLKTNYMCMSMYMYTCSTQISICNMTCSRYLCSYLLTEFVQCEPAAGASNLNGSKSTQRIKAEVSSVRAGLTCKLSVSKPPNQKTKNASTQALRNCVGSPWRPWVSGCCLSLSCVLACFFSLSLSLSLSLFCKKERKTYYT